MKAQEEVRDSRPLLDRGCPLPPCYSSTDVHKVAKLIVKMVIESERVAHSKVSRESWINQGSIPAQSRLSKVSNLCSSTTCLPYKQSDTGSHTDETRSTYAPPQPLEPQKGLHCEQLQQQQESCSLDEQQHSAFLGQGQQQHSIVGAHVVSPLSPSMTSSALAAEYPLPKPKIDSHYPHYSSFLVAKNLGNTSEATASSLRLSSQSNEDNYVGAVCLENADTSLHTHEAAAPLPHLQSNQLRESVSQQLKQQQQSLHITARDRISPIDYLVLPSACQSLRHAPAFSSVNSNIPFEASFLSTTASSLADGAVAEASSDDAVDIAAQYRAPSEESPSATAAVGEARYYFDSNSSSNFRKNISATQSLECTHPRFLIGVGGIPGSGKSTFALALGKHLELLLQAAKPSAATSPAAQAARGTLADTESGESWSHKPDHWHHQQERQQLRSVKRSRQEHIKPVVGHYSSEGSECASADAADIAASGRSCLQYTSSQAPPPAVIRGRQEAAAEGRGSPNPYSDTRYREALPTTSFFFEKEEFRRLYVAVFSMDSYHFTREQLRNFPLPEEALRRRGAPWTINSKEFWAALRLVKYRCERPLFLPTFDHAIKDPVADSCCITPQHRVVVVEGLYVCLKCGDEKDEAVAANTHTPSTATDHVGATVQHLTETNASTVGGPCTVSKSSILNVRLFIDIPLETAEKRIIKRHMAAGICATREEAEWRWKTSDSLNAKFVLENVDINRLTAVIVEESHS